jgi:hypothetical protein
VSPYIQQFVLAPESHPAEEVKYLLKGFFLMLYVVQVLQYKVNQKAEL